MDAVALSMPIGLGLVRLGNFLNGELFGKPTSGSWGFIFPTDPYGYPDILHKFMNLFWKVCFVLCFIFSQ